MTPIVQHRIAWADLARGNPDVWWGREWLVTNGLGGYASGTISGACTRRYHGLLVAALPAPLGRTLMLNHLAEECRLPTGEVIRLDIDAPEEYPAEWPTGYLTEFRLEGGLPVWSYQAGDCRLEKRIHMPHEQNTTHITYRLVEAPSAVKLRLRPSLHFRAHEAAVGGELPLNYSVAAWGPRIEVKSPETPPLRLSLRAQGGSLILDGGRHIRVRYRIEGARGYESEGNLWSPGYFRVSLGPGQDASLIASTEEWDTVSAIDPARAWDMELLRREVLLARAVPAARAGLGAELVLAADSFIIRPATRVADAAQAHAAGDDVRTVIAGYHWFTDWGRDTMISLEGLTLATGRCQEAGYLLRTFGRYVRDGLIPNLFPEGERDGLYHTADATLWYFQALARYVAATRDQDTLRGLLPTLIEIVNRHEAGTRFGIGVDPRYGLLRQGAEGYQLTWMDAKVGDWVVTPRRGKAVEINALWHNALCWLAAWTLDAGDSSASERFSGLATRARESFNRRFWYEAGGHLYDVVDGEGGDDAALRPNQLLAISLDHPILESGRWSSVLEAVRRALLTPVGLRSLAPDHPDYKPTYHGDLRTRDAAYHQGTVWAWLIGPYIDAWMRVHPDQESEARSLLAGFQSHLDEACVGSISEVFDATAPYHPRGCIAQAWSVAEVLRCWVKTDGAGSGDVA
jgi:predicted glycogen debranching enzyme